jgi:hypothetical protein
VCASIGNRAAMRALVLGASETSFANAGENSPRYASSWRGRGGALIVLVPKGGDVSRANSRGLAGDQQGKAALFVLNGVYSGA